MTPSALFSTIHQIFFPPLISSFTAELLLLSLAGSGLLHHLTSLSSYFFLAFSSQFKSHSPFPSHSPLTTRSQINPFTVCFLASVPPTYKYDDLLSSLPGILLSSIFLSSCQCCLELIVISIHVLGSLCRVRFFVTHGL